MSNHKASERSGYHQFKKEDGELFGSFEIFWNDSGVPQHGTEPRNFDSNGKPVKPGWYWWACWPEYECNGTPNGPFATSTEAYDDAQQNWENC